MNSVQEFYERFPYPNYDGELKMDLSGEYFISPLVGTNNTVEF